MKKRHCVSCDQFKMEEAFPAPGALYCTMCNNTTKSPLYLDPIATTSAGRLGLPAGGIGTHSNPEFARSVPGKGGRWYSPADDTIRTQRATRHDDSVAKMLLGKSREARLAEHAHVVRPDAAPDDRPLIDVLHEATFNNDAPGLYYIKDKYALRMLLRKAHCFTLDKITSGMVGDFSVAIAADMESARRMSIPPFPVTWIDIDNRARLQRMLELGITLTDTAAGRTAAGEAVERVGWLIHPGDRGGYFLTYCTVVEQGVVLSPLSWWWHCGSPGTVERVEERDEYIQWLTYGLREVNVGPADAYPDVTPLHFTLKETEKDRDHVNEMMKELAGELRHVWGFLIALGAGQLGMEVKYGEQTKPTTVRTMKNGKPLLPLEHKVLHLHLAKKMTAAKVMLRMITHHKHRWHEVRSHFRTLKNADGSVRARVPVKAHERGDKLLGRIEKQYRVER